MNQQSHASCSCDDWGELIIAMLDHELTADERVATERTWPAASTAASALRRLRVSIS